MGGGDTLMSVQFGCQVESTTDISQNSSLCITNRLPELMYNCPTNRQEKGDSLSDCMAKAQENLNELKKSAAATINKGNANAK